MFQILALYLDVESANKIHVLEVLILGFGVHWWFETVAWHLDLDLDIVTGPWNTQALNFGPLS